MDSRWRQLPRCVLLGAMVALAGAQMHLSVGAQFSCALWEQRHVKCWGGNNVGQLGYGNKDVYAWANESLPEVDLGSQDILSGLSCGAYHSCVLFASGHRVKCWGSNKEGQLGDRNQLDRGDGPGEMGENLPFVPLPGPIATVGTGTSHSCAMTVTGTVHCWGKNSEGQLGQGFASRGINSCCSFAQVDLGEGRSARALSVGSAHTCALLDNFDLKCWGRNWFGQLGYGDGIDRGGAAHQMGDNLPPVSLGTGMQVKTLDLGRDYSCVVLDNNDLKCWGNGYWGSLGLGDESTRGLSVGQMGDYLPTVNLGTGRKVFKISSGESTYVLLDDGNLKSFGRNYAGQLGYGDRIQRGTSQITMGDGLPAVDLGGDVSELSSATADRYSGHMCAVMSGGGAKCWGSGALGNGEGYWQLGDELGEMGDDLPLLLPWSGPTPTTSSTTTSTTSPTTTSTTTTGTTTTSTTTGTSTTSTSTTSPTTTSTSTTSPTMTPTSTTSRTMTSTATTTARRGLGIAVGVAATAAVGCIAVGCLFIYMCKHRRQPPNDDPGLELRSNS